MIQFTKAQMSVLSKYEPYFKTAVYCDYIRAVRRVDSEMVAQIWRDAKDAEFRFNPSCGGCVLDLFKKVGTVYFAEKELQELEAEKKKQKRTTKKK